METEVEAAVTALQSLAKNAADPVAINAIATGLQTAHDNLKAAVDAAVPPVAPA